MQLCNQRHKQTPMLFLYNKQTQAVLSCCLSVKCVMKPLIVFLSPPFPPFLHLGSPHLFPVFSKASFLLSVSSHLFLSFHRSPFPLCLFFSHGSMIGDFKLPLNFIIKPHSCSYCPCCLPPNTPRYARTHTGSICHQDKNPCQRQLEGQKKEKWETECLFCKKQKIFSGVFDARKSTKARRAEKGDKDQNTTCNLVF